MFTQNKKILITSAIGFLLVSILCVPLAYASTDNELPEAKSSKVRTLIAKGVARAKPVSESEFVPADFSLDLEATEINPGIINFNVIGGTVEIEEVEYTIIEGEGVVILYKRGFLLKAHGLAPNGEEVTLKLAGRYFWMWGRLYVARLFGALEAESTTNLLFLRSAIRV